MSTEDQQGPDAGTPTADDLRMRAIEYQMAEFEKERKKRQEEEERQAAFADSFLRDHVSELELTKIRRLVISAVSHGKTEALIYSFPSTLCSDQGRAINNAEPNWPETLQGKAKELYEGYKANGEDKGYKLKAMILNYPGGMPGDVGLFLSWA